MSLILVAKIYFHLLMIFLGVISTILEYVIWPHFVPGIPSPHFLLNTFLAATICLVSQETFLLTFFFSSLNASQTSFPIGYVWTPYVIIWLLIDLLKKHTFLVSERKFFRFIFLCYVCYHVVINLIDWLLYSRQTHQNFLQLLLLFLISSIIFQFQIKLFNKILTAWKKTKWGALIHE
ncbi:MAG: hypothetical protein RMK80_04665 [Pseudobdellovibrionaceae bacterium]|nr:hypothetical protein [Pseudobdellovibrionaceae bacterium]